MNRHTKKSIVIIVACLLLVVGVMRIIYVNIKTPEKEIEYVDKGKKDTVLPNIQMRINSSKWFGYDEMVDHLKRTYNIDSDELEEEQKFLLVDVTVKNVSKKMEHAILCNIYLEGKGTVYDANGMFLFGPINEKDMEIDMKSGEEMNLTLCYCMQTKEVACDKQYSEFYLVGTKYPVKKMWRLR